MTHFHPARYIARENRFDVKVCEVERVYACVKNVCTRGGAGRACPPLFCSGMPRAPPLNTIIIPPP